VEATNTHTGLTINRLDERQSMTAIINIQVLSVNEARFINIFGHLLLDQRRADLRTIELHDAPAVSTLMDVEPRATKRP
jgi:hypothetical protein